MIFYIVLKRQSLLFFLFKQESAILKLLNIERRINNMGGLRIINIQLKAADPRLYGLCGCLSNHFPLRKVFRHG